MKKKKCWAAFLTILVFTVLSSNAMALVIPFNLNDFNADGFVLSNSAGTKAGILGKGSLSNDPLAGAPGIAITENALSLSFDYLFIEPRKQDVAFSASLYDGVSGEILDDFAIQHSSSGNVSFDLSGRYASTTMLGLNFSVDALSGSKNWALAIIKNPRLTTSDTAPAPAPVPEPATMLLMGAGLMVLAGFGRKKILSLA
ncbi:MAG: PEP-CTERM sorting domain-containing protein [Desulfobacterales bacterium]|nr:PEP-CTERM sorting domain-containing protein [Desulfobacterales bacterium]